MEVDSTELRALVGLNNNSPTEGDEDGVIPLLIENGDALVVVESRS